MPELPEVETVVRDLGKRMAGRTIRSAELRRERLAPDITPSEFAERLNEASVSRVHRRGKHILIDLENGNTLIVHLRMSGRFMLLSQDDTDPKFAHAVFHLEDGSRFVFDDQRHFGLMKVVDTSRIAETKELAKLAPEPFSEEFSPQHLAEQIRSSNRVLKEILLDQTKVCGVGNIYASEAMFLAGVNPKRRGRTLSAARCSRLHEYVRAVLLEAIEQAALIEPHPSIVGEGVYGGESDGHWRVYDREGKPCPACGTVIRRIRQGGRSTYYCPKCQR